jgi:hypothetical protein
MNFTAALEAFFASDTGRYAALVLILPVIDWTLGTLAAIRDGTFQLDSLLAFVRKQIAGRVLPIWILMFLGYITNDLVIPGVEWPVFSTFGTVLAIGYIVETIGSIMRSWGPKAAPGEPQTLLNRDPVQPVPHE